ncbi:conserved phage C-terminal domain-containing protein [Niallia taxi]|uniref:conserved phage C-terminal domain-containing protein n=1 Tax=Niallia taxi TaxID=2499688 RepID=UPI0021752FA1|nr:conserved phage C-terminal domain-containing protein [Niallia taxi]
MARPTKEGLEYFPLDTDIDQDEKIIVVVAKFGMRGFGVIVRLMMEVYRNGYFYHWTEKEQYVFSMKIVETAEFVNEVVQECLKWGFFDSELYEKYGILTSKGFQKRFLLAVNRRKGVIIKTEYNLTDEVNVDNNLVNDDINEEIEDINPTKEKKVKESKVNKDINVYQEILSYLNEKAGKNYSYKSAANKKLINGRMSEGRTVEDFKHVIDVKCEQWLKDEKMCEYLRPATLFAQKNFENYVNQGSIKKQTIPADPRDKDIKFSKWIANGGDPDAFDWSG